MSIYDIFTEQLQYDIPLLSITIGIVTDIDDPEKRGRVKVKLINRTTSDYETDYIRTMTPMSGKESGFYFLPEVGDEVLVGFCDGDIHSPYVLGSLWNKNNKQPAEIKDKKNDIRMIKTKSGHTITFNEEKDKEAIVLTTAAGMTISMEDKETVITVSDKDKKNTIILDAKNNEIKITADGKVNLTAKDCYAVLDGQDISLKTKGKLVFDAQDVNINAKNNVNISGANIKMEAKSSGTIKANAKLDISASGPVNLKGAIVKIN
ncbi:MAG: phage baseplate assembly protein V [Oscillospiraceae bacterium]